MAAPRDLKTIAERTLRVLSGSDPPWEVARESADQGSVFWHLTRTDQDQALLQLVLKESPEEAAAALEKEERESNGPAEPFEGVGQRALIWRDEYKPLVMILFRIDSLYAHINAPDENAGRELADAIVRGAG